VSAAIRWGTGTLAVLLLIPVVLARLPESFRVADHRLGILIRVLATVVVLWGIAWLRALLYCRLRAAPFLFAGRLALLDHGRRQYLDVDRVADVFVELAPPPLEEIFMLELDDGTSRPLCPVGWKGAGRLYQGLRKAIDRRARLDAAAER